MLIFNCTKAAKEFFTVTRRGNKVCPVEKPVSKDFAKDSDWLRDGSGNTPDHCSQWVVHCIKVQRKNVLQVMEIQSRYCMSFAGFRKGDVTGFVEGFLNRLLNNMHHIALDYALVDDNEAVFQGMGLRFQQQHAEFRFFERSDRSVIAHLKEAAFLFDCDAYDYGFPEDDATFDLIDDRSNDGIRTTRDSRKGKKQYEGYFTPKVEFFADFLKRYLGGDDQYEAQFREDYRQRKRSRFADLIEQNAAELAGHQSESCELNDMSLTELHDADALPDRVVSLDAFKAKKLH